MTLPLLRSIHLPHRYGRSPSGPVVTDGRSVYLISTPSGFYKVGVAGNPKGRFRAVKTGCPEKPCLMGYTEIAPGGVSPFEMERLIHVLLGRFRSHGEWFKTTDLDVYAAWKLAWTYLAKPNVAERYLRFRRRMREKFFTKYNLERPSDFAETYKDRSYIYNRRYYLKRKRRAGGSKNTVPNSP